METTKLRAKIREAYLLALDDDKLWSKLRSAATEANVDESSGYKAFLALTHRNLYGQGLRTEIEELPTILKAVVIQEFIRETTEGTVYQMLEALDIKPDFHDEEFLLR
jgi:hypothetical protein